MWGENGRRGRSGLACSVLLSVAAGCGVEEEGAELELAVSTAALEDVGIVQLPDYCDEVDCSSAIICTPQADSCGCCTLDIGDAEDLPPKVDIPWHPGGEGSGGGTTGGGDDDPPPPTPSEEDCETPADDDGDGEINCEDSDCFTGRDRKSVV